MDEIAKGFLKNLGLGARRQEEMLIIREHDEERQIVNSPMSKVDSESG